MLNVKDGLMEEFKISNPDFYNQYFNARPTLESHRHTTIGVETIDEITGEDLSEVQVLITSDKDNFIEMTDIQCFAKKQVTSEVNYKVKFILPDYEVQEFEKVNLNAGDHERLSVKLKKIVP